MRAVPTDTSRLPPAAVRVAGVAISNPERPVVAAPGHSKLDVVRYHERMAHWLLPQQRTEDDASDARRLKS